ncbi:MAG: FHA domain-containing protein, partial [Anaerolineales bacterium]|nr:FHA domain-containing protein [Anaerolineales bacterium]
DLTKYRAYECGVSRLHAVLRKKKHKLFVMDLGSSNGTFLNGKRLEANQEYALRNGAVLSLGKLKIQVLFRK